jgi:hypothetical protein
MGIIEQIFSELLEGKYRQHDVIQRKEDEKLYRKSLELNQVDELTDVFEKKMEIAAHEMEQWLMKHKNGNY